MRKVYGDEHIDVRRSQFEHDSNSGSGPEAGKAIGQLVAACHVDPVGDAMKELDHMLRKSPATPVQARLVAAIRVLLPIATTNPVTAMALTPSLTLIYYGLSFF